MPNIVGYTPWGAPIWDTDTRETIIDPTNASRTPPPASAQGALSASVKGPAGGALYAEEAAAGQRLSAQKILADIRQSDASANASLQSAQAALKAANIQADDLKERMRQFDVTTAEGRRQFDLSFGLDREKFELDRQRAQLEGAQTILNAPRGPADFFAYAARALPAAQAGGSLLENIFGKSLEAISGDTLAQLREGPVLSNTELATDLVKASRGEAVSDATATFLRRSLGVKIPSASDIAAQQAQQQAATAAPGGVPTPPPITTGQGGGYMAPWTVLPFEEWLAQNGYDTPYMGGYEGGGEYSDPNQIAGYRRSAAQGEAAAAFERDKPYMSQGDIMKGFSSKTSINTGKPMYELRGDYAAYVQGTMQNEQLRQQQTVGATTPYTPVGGGGGGGRSGNPVLDAILAGGRSFNERLGALAGQIPRGYGTSLQEYNRLGPSLQAMYTSLLSESGLETPEDFLAGVVRAAPNFGSSNTARAGIR